MKTTDKSSLEPDLLNDPLFWEKAWQLELENSFFRRGRKTLKDTVNFWNKRADNYQKNVMGKKGNKRVNRVLGWLDKQGVDLAGKRVLDIGAGPGAFTLALAECCETVVALEPAEAMVEYLQSELARSGCDNVRVIHDTWEEVDLDQEGLLGSFDLVFASMSPGINNLATVQKAMDCSKEYFYYSSFAGRRESDLLKELWPVLYGEKLPSWPGQVIFVLNLLYTLDLQLNFEVWEERRRVEQTEAEAVENFLEELKAHGKEPPYPQNELQDFVSTKATHGLLRQENVTRLGQILVRK